jgi:hypothetical protein
VDLSKEKVTLETDRYRVEGSMTLPAVGYRSRLSDHLNRRDVEFFTIQDALLTPLGDGEGWRAPVVMIARRHVRVVVPEEAANSD